MRTRVTAALTAALLITALTGSTARADTESWTTTTPTQYARSTPTTRLTIVSDKGAKDGKALRLTLPARAKAGPGRGVGVTSTKSYRYGTFSSRLKTADCHSQKNAGVVTGTFTFANDGQDHDGDGITDNDEIDIEFLCAQPEVVYLTIWTEYSETDDTFDATSRTINLRTGTILSTCHRTSWDDECKPQNTRITKIKDFDSSQRFRTYGFDWQPDHVTYFTYDDTGRRITLWNYRGPHIPDTAAPFMQNVWHSDNWDPIGRQAHAATTRPVNAYIDTTTVR